MRWPPSIRVFAGVGDVPANRYRHVYLEPHFDDIALSCGGTIAAQTARGEPVLVVTVFAGNPGAGAPVTDFAAGQHERWGGAPDPIAARRDEQVAALSLLGADWLPLDFFDAIYRGDQYLSDADLFGSVKPGDVGLVEAVTATLLTVAERAPGTTWYVPLAVGSHVDHQIVLAASQELAPRLAYEDFPYATRSGAVAARVTALGARPAASVDVAEQLERKLAAIGCYRSQIPTLFGDVAAMAGAVREYTTDGASRSAVERYWRLRADVRGKSGSRARRDSSRSLP